MPESKKRRGATSRRVPATAGATVAKKRGPSPRWLAPLMLVLFGLGILWLVVYYLTEARMGGIPGIEDLGDWTLLVGFAFIILGFGLSTQWR